MRKAKPSKMTKKLLFLFLILCMIVKTYAQECGCTGIEERLNCIKACEDQLKVENTIVKKIRFRNSDYSVFVKDDTILGIKKHESIRPDRKQIIQPANLSKLTVLFSTNEPMYIVVRCETPVNFSRSYQLETDYYAFFEDELQLICKDSCFECLVGDIPVYAKMSGLVRKAKRKVS